jgi:AcrR family transcriptional regulator/ribosomal protein S18 acetylase RimI-like enzyme
MSDKKSRNHQALQAERRRLLIDATMSAIAGHGLSNLTLAKIAAEAGLSAGTVNFHFESKEALLLETLTTVANEFEERILRSQAEAGKDPADRLLALFEASLDPQVTEHRKTSVWFAFAAEARSRADYQRICGAQEKKIFAITHSLCEQIIGSNKNAKHMNARAMANAVQGLIDEIWEEILYTGDSYDREQARFMYLAFLASVFPWAFSQPDEPSNKRKQGKITIKLASSKDSKEVAALFDLYRQFYEEAADPALAQRFIRQNISGKRSSIYLARNGENEAVGFVQLYDSWCSVEAAPICILYDLYVDENARQGGVGRKLMQAAEKHARKKKACRIDLETGRDNLIGQALYEDLGYERDEAFYSYSLELE